MLVKNKIQRGVTLVEAMIALLVISVGLLGIASLQITAVSQNASALNHNKAVWIAYTISDRIRANLPAFAAPPLPIPSNAKRRIATTPKW
jgi:type IV pilus assembly protein PilV